MLVVLADFALWQTRSIEKACCTRHGLVVVVAAVLGGPVGMTGYLTAIENIGSGYTACISAFYPAFGALLAVFF